MQYIIDTSAPFRGICQSIIDNNGIVAYTGGQTFDEYLAEHGNHFCLVSEIEFDGMLEFHYSTLVTEPVRKTRAGFWKALECLPPERWHNHRGVELFCMCEYLQGNLTSWHARLNNKHYTFTDRANASSEHLAAKVLAAAA